MFEIWGVRVFTYLALWSLFFLAIKVSSLLLLYVRGRIFLYLKEFSPEKAELRSIYRSTSSHFIIVKKISLVILKTSPNYSTLITYD